MSNFHPKLQDATEEELMHMVNELDFRVVPLASDELTRRVIGKLQRTIEESNEHSEKLELANYKIQMTMVVLTAIGTLIVAFPTLKFIFQWIGIQLAKIAMIHFIFSNTAVNLVAAILSIAIALRINNNLKEIGDMQKKMTELRKKIDLLKEDIL